ncbi:hypothetical protein QBC39DRAFT_252628 [Podospora conica]|nr:hypothetical protein QBC39DRAFT_252628 [Schizothecium conicum]
MSQHSWSAVERGNPPPRRKSCAACIKAKRRCTLDSPSCLRCTQRLIECRYPDAPAPKRRAPRPRFVEKDSGAFPAPTPSLPPHIVQLEASPDPLAIPDVPPEYLNIAQDPVVFEVNATPDFFNQPPPSHGPDPTGVYHHALPIVTPRHDPPPRTPPTTVATRLELNPVLHAITDRLQFSMDKLFASVNQMVLECGTPWCHPSIYQNFMPKVLEDALTSCALYTAKNPLNARLILRTIEARGNALLATPLPSAPSDILAHVHALLLYQIIRTFDGDPSLRATAEAGILPLMDGAFALMPFLRFDKGTFEPYGLETPEPVSTAERAALEAIIEQRAPLLPDASAVLFWETWALEESMRRTFVMALFFVRVYQLVTGETPEQMCDGKLGLCHSYTVSAHLWRATDAGEFAERWRSKGHFVVKNTDFKEILMNAGADDLDDFTKILLCALLGRDAVAKWFVDRGGCLE